MFDLRLKPSSLKSPNDSSFFFSTSERSLSLFCPMTSAVMHRDRRSWKIKQQETIIFQHSLHARDSWCFHPCISFWATRSPWDSTLPLSLLQQFLYALHGTFGNGKIGANEKGTRVLDSGLGPGATLFHPVSYYSAGLWEPYKWRGEGKTNWKKTPPMEMWKAGCGTCHCPLLWSPKPSLSLSSRNC